MGIVFVDGKIYDDVLPLNYIPDYYEKEKVREALINRDLRIEAPKKSFLEYDEILYEIEKRYPR
jgi:hypothetical protein